MGLLEVVDPIDEAPITTRRARYKPAADVVAEDFAGQQPEDREMLLYRSAGPTACVLNASSSAIWDLCVMGAEAEAIAHLLAEGIDADPRALFPDVIRTLSDLTTAGFLERVPRGKP